MNRIEFMDRVSQLLADLPENERSEALQYYNDYLDDAGVENEQEVLEALGTPDQLAVSIREGLNEDSIKQGEFSETGYRKQSENDSEDQLMPGYGRGDHAGDFYKRYRSKETDGHNGRTKEEAKARGKRTKNGMSTGTLILLVICGIFAAPILLPLALALVVVMLALAAVAIVVALALLFSGIICIAAGLWALFTAIIKLFVVPAGALVAVGISLMVIGIGILLVLAMGWILGKLFPTAFRGCVHFCSRLFGRKGGKQV